jgi:hypothetical protein
LYKVKQSALKKRSVPLWNRQMENNKHIINKTKKLYVIVPFCHNLYQKGTAKNYSEDICQGYFWLEFLGGPSRQSFNKILSGVLK